MNSELHLYRLRLGSGASVSLGSPSRPKLKALIFSALAINSPTVYIAATPDSVSLISSSKWNKPTQALLTKLWTSTADKTGLVSRLRVTTMSEQHLSQGEQALTQPKLTKRVLSGVSQ